MSVPSNTVPLEVAERIRAKYFPKKAVTVHTGPRLVKHARTETASAASPEEYEEEAPPAQDVASAGPADGRGRDCSRAAEAEDSRIEGRAASTAGPGSSGARNRRAAGCRADSCRGARARTTATVAARRNSRAGRATAGGGAAATAYGAAGASLTAEAGTTPASSRRGKTRRAGIKAHAAETGRAARQFPSNGIDCRCSRRADRRAQAAFAHYIHTAGHRPPAQAHPSRQAYARRCGPGRGQAS